MHLEQSTSHHHDCCTESLGEHEINALNTCIEESSKVNVIERNSLYCICHYVAHKEKNMIMDPNEIGSENESEFLRNVTRGKLFDFSLYCIVAINASVTRRTHTVNQEISDYM